VTKRAEYGGGAFVHPKGPSSWTVRRAADPLPNTKLTGHSFYYCCLRRINQIRLSRADDVRPHKRDASASPT